MKKILVILLLSSFSWLLAGEAILAKVGEIEITKADLQARIEALPPQYVAFYATQDGKKKLLDQLVQEKLLYLEAKDKGYEKEPEVQNLIARSKEEVLTNYLLKKEIEKVTVSDKEIKDYYDGNKDKYKVGTTVRASHILVQSKANADGLLAQLNAGSDFAELAKEHSICPSGKKGGDLDFFTQGQMVKPFEDAAFALNVGEITKAPVQTQFGWHIIKLTDKQPGRQRELNEAKQEIRSELLRKKQKEKLDRLITAAEKKYTVAKHEANLNNF